MKSTSNLVEQKRELAKLWLRYRVPGTFAVVLALVLGAGSSLWETYRDSNQSSHALDSDVLINQFSTVLGNPVAAQQKSLAGLSSDDELAVLIGTTDAAARKSARATLMQQLPDSLGVRLLANGARKIDYENGFPPISYGTLDLARQSAASTRLAPAQVHLVGRDEQHIALLRKVMSGDKLIGHVLVAYPSTLLNAAMVKAPANSLYVELIQRMPGASAVVFGNAGDASVKEGVGRVVPIRDTSWRLVFWLPSSTSDELTVLADLLPIIAAVLVLLLVGLAGATLATRKKCREGARIMLGGAVTTVDFNEDDEPKDALADVPTVFSHTESATALPPLLSESCGLDLDFFDDDEESASVAMPSPSSSGLNPVIFRAYDIRGMVGHGLDADVVRLIGRAIGTEAYERGQQTIIVARDGRISSDELCDALIEGLLSTGRDVVDVGRVPTPVLYFSTYFLDTGSGVMVTGSHNPAQYNGLKIMLGGETLFGDAIQKLRQRAENGQFHQGQGELQQMDLLADYIRRVSEDVPVALGNAYKVVIDCGNGVAGDVAPKLIQALGHDVVKLYCDIDGTFPNHAPDPTQPENLRDLIAKVADEGADLGLAFDGDGDRVGVVDGSGNIIWADRLMMLYAQDILSRHAGASIVYDVKCTSRLRQVIEANGGVPIMDKTGHSFMKNKLLETPDAQLAGELSGHIFFKERWYGFDDGMYAAARLLEILMADGRPAADVFADLPAGVSTHELHIQLEEGEPFNIMQTLLVDPQIEGASISTIDGIRAEFADGWGLLRASNTTPSLICRFEGDDAAALERVQAVFRSLLNAVKSDLDLPF